MHTLSPAVFFKTAARTATHFGFTPLETLLTERAAKRIVPAARPSASDRRLDALGGLLTAGPTVYFDRGLYDGAPVFFYSAQNAEAGALTFSLHIAGVRKSIAESLIIQTMRSLLSDLGHDRHCVRINSLGDQESVARYIRELTGYLKKRLADVPPSVRDEMREDALSAFLTLSAQGHELASRGPSSLEYLSDTSRRHFREIVEHLDMTETPYEIDPRLIGHHRCYTDTLFSIELRDAGDSPLAAPIAIRGGRLDAFVRNAFKIEAPVVGAVITLESKKAPNRLPPPPRRSPVPSIFMVHLGFGPKVRGLMLLNALKHADIRVHQALTSDSLGEQLRQAEAYKVPFSLILGQKEYVENSVIIRDMQSRSQQSIPFDTLIPHLKRLLKRV